MPEPSAAPIGSEKFPLFCQARKKAHALSLPAAIINEKPYPINLIVKDGIYQYEKRRYKKYELSGFGTPSGKIEIYPQRLKDIGMDPSPIRNDIFKRRGESDAFPLILTTGGNILSYTHWQYRYIPKLRKMFPEPIFEIHPDTAQHYGLMDGEIAEVITRYGKIKLKTHVTPRIRPGTIHVHQGWEEANANELTGPEDHDPISGFPNLKSVKCNIQKLL